MPVEGHASKAKRSVSASDQALKAKSSDQTLKASVSDSIQSSSDQPVSESKPSNSFQFKTNVPISSSSQSSHCTLAIAKSSVNIDNFLRDRINSLLRKEILYIDIFEEMESTGKNELIWGQKSREYRKNCW